MKLGLFEAEGRVLVPQQAGVGVDSVAPAVNADDKIKHAPRELLGEQNGEEGDKAYDHSDNKQREQNDVLGNCQEPFHERQPAAEFLRVVDLVGYRVLAFVPGKRRVLVAEQSKVGAKVGAPAVDSHDEVEEATRVAFGKEDREESDETNDRNDDAKGINDKIVGESQQPLTKISQRESSVGYSTS